MKIQMNLYVRLTILLLAVFTATPGIAKIRLPKLISDRMVLQRDTELKIWGWADQGETVTVRFQGKHYNAEAGTDGKWMVTLPAQKAGGPYILEVNEIVVRDVLVGDVWLCSGQSNMETPVTRLTDMFPEINVSNNHMVRCYKVPTQNDVYGVNDEIAGDAVWHSAIASDVMNWTALAYFYAQEAYRHTGVPVGMLVSSLGGSSIESWISEEHLCKFPEPAFLRNDRYTMNVPGRWKDNGIDCRGAVWHQKEIDLPASMHHKHAKLYLGTLVDSDSTFVNGHFVGRTTYTYPPRKYDIPAGILRQGRNIIAVRIQSQAGNGEFIADKPYKLVSDGFEMDLTGQWTCQIEKGNVRVEQLTGVKRVGSGLYNGMIYPLRDYAVKGAIWYQGESNAGFAGQYAGMLQSLIANWRDLWKMPQMPFLLVQLPNFMEKRAQPSNSGWANIREAQFQTALAVSNTALAVTYDIGEWNDIHPLNKKEMAHRLFLGARKLVYGEKLVSSGPLYRSMKVEGDKIVITFTETGSGLACKGKKLNHFAIAGEDKKFVWADAVIKGNTVVVSSPDVKVPVAVRYAWADNPEDANLINKEGLLASPFRTDSW